MISRKIHDFSTDSGESIDNLRESQLVHSFILPSDYVYFLLNYNNLKFEERPVLEFKDNPYELFSFNNLEYIIWEINHYRDLSKNEETSFWLNNYICVAQLVNKRLLLGNSANNINKVFIYDNQEDFIEPICDNIFQFINDFLIYDSSL